jgi:hypothetical protein
MERDFKVGDIVIRNSIGGHATIKEGTKWIVVKILDGEEYIEKPIIVGRLTGEGEQSLYEERLMSRRFFDFAQNNYRNTSKYGNNYKAKVAT